MARKPAQKSKRVAKTRKKTGSWKKTAISKRNIKKVKKNLVQYTVVFSLFSFSLLTIFTFISYKKLTSPFVSASSISSFDIRNEDIFTLAYISVNNKASDFITTTSVKVFFFDTKNNKVLTYEVPVDRELDIVGRYKTEKVSKILGMGAALNDDSFDAGVDLLNKSLAKYFGFIIDRYIVIEDSLKDDGFEQKLLSENASIPLNLQFLNDINSSMVTNLRINEMYYIYNYFRSLTEDRVISADITNFDEQILDLTFDSTLALEKKTIAILNGTNVSGLANAAARVVENMGGRIIVVGNASSKYETTTLVVDDMQSETVSKMSRYFNVDKVLIRNSQSEVFESEINRVDITLILGIDNINLL